MTTQQVTDAVGTAPPRRGTVLPAPSRLAALPPGPRYWPLQSFHLIRDAGALLRRCARIHGDPFTLPLGDGPKVVTGDPALIREIFSADPDIFDPPAPEMIEPLFGSTSMILSGGAAHRRKRKLMMPPFHGARMRAYGRLLQEITAAHAAALQPGQRFDALHMAQSIALDVILRAVFGVQEGDRMRLLRGAIVENFERFTPAIFYFRFLRRELGGRGPWSAYLRSVATLDRLMQEEIAARRSEPPKDDILSLLLATRDEDGRPMSDEELRGELRTLLIAGHETSAVAIAWALYELARHPDVARRLREELAALGPSPDPERVVASPYLGAVCDEVLRLHPVAPMVVRTLNRPAIFGGRAYDAGTVLAPSMWVVHFDERLYPEPDSFRPERFLSRAYSPFEYMPFGGGSRRCIGAAFAAYEIKLVVAMLHAQHRLAMVDERPLGTAMRGLTFGPSGAVEMRYLGEAPCAPRREEPVHPAA